MFESFKKAISPEKQFSEDLKKNDVENSLPFAFENKEVMVNKILSLVERFHTNNVKVIFLTWSASSLYGYMLKEIWKTAYPDEEIPKFYFVNPKPSKHLEFVKIEDRERRSELMKKINDERERLEEVIEIIKKENKKTNIAIFDESYTIGNPSSPFRFGKSVNIAKEMLIDGFKALGLRDIEKRLYMDGLGIDTRSYPYLLFRPVTEEVGISKDRKRFRPEDAPVIMGQEAIDVFKKIGREIGEKLSNKK